MAPLQLTADDEVIEHDSPIETQLATAMYRHLRVHCLAIEPQFRIDRYRYDFGIFLNHRRIGPNKPRLLIECDGRAYHSTLDQLANDARKNDLARHYKIPLLRFTGSQIYNAPEGCVAQILRALLQQALT